MLEVIEINWYPALYSLLSILLINLCSYITWLNIRDTRRASRLMAEPNRKRYGKR